MEHKHETITYSRAAAAVGRGGGASNGASAPSGGAKGIGQ